MDKIKELSALFAIDVYAYAMMDNQYHLMLHVDQERSLDWGDEEEVVVGRWKVLFLGALLVDR